MTTNNNKLDLRACPLPALCEWVAVKDDGVSEVCASKEERNSKELRAVALAFEAAGKEGA